MNYYNLDFYKILEIDYTATEEEIKAAYRKLVMKHHPDVSKNPDDEQIFKNIKQAYDVLSDATERRKYDILNGFFRERIKAERKKDIKTENFQPKNKTNKAEKEQNQKKAEHASFSDSVNDVIDSLFGNAVKHKSEKKTKTVNGEDIYHDVSINVYEALNGTERHVNILHTEPCPKCGGHKFINDSNCSVCSGSGQTSSHKKLTVKIPAGVSNDSVVRIKGEGNRGIGGGKDGDLYLKVKIKKDNGFDFDGLDVLTELPVTPFEAALGADIPLFVRSEKINVKIPANISSGQKLKIQGYGLEKKSKRGNLIITVIIKLPPVLSEEEKKLYEKLKEISNYDIRRDFNK